VSNIKGKNICNNIMSKHYKKGRLVRSDGGVISGGCARNPQEICCTESADGGNPEMALGYPDEWDGWQGGLRDPESHFYSIEAIKWKKG
jgi:hypothetical protein